MSKSNASLSESASRFAATRWNIVLAAGHGQTGTAAQRAMGELATQYWFPLYAYLRRKGNAPADAEDLIQGFFTRLLEKDALAAVDRSKGKFRTFLLASLKNFTANEWDKNRAAKRGGSRHVLSLDTLQAEARYALEPVDKMTPERLFEQRWAWSVLDHVLEQLRRQYHANGQGNLFDALKGSLTSDASFTGYAPVARKLGLSEATLSVAAHRLRRRYRTLLREQIAQTVSTPEQVDEEIKFLLSCL